jgi:hypothetical protein
MRSPCGPKMAIVEDGAAAGGRLDVLVVPVTA